MISQDSRELVRRALLIYEQQLKQRLEATHRNSFVAIEPDSGDYFLGPTLSEASAEARKVYPDRRTYVHRVGHATTVTFGVLQIMAAGASGEAGATAAPPG